MQRGDDSRACGRLLYTRADLRKVGIRAGNSSLLRWEAAGTFPERIRLSGHSVAWISEEVDAHIAALASNRRCAK